VTPLKLKIVIALALTDAVVRDANIISVRPFFSSLHPHPHPYMDFLKRETPNIDI
jgi:hypothetical protein